MDEALDRTIPPQTSWFHATARCAVSVGGDGLSSEELPLELRPSAPRKHLAIGVALAAAIAVAVAVAEAADSYLWIAIGSALGGMARHWCNTLATQWLGPSFPWGTLFINVTGSLIIGFFFALTDGSGRFDVSANAKLFVMTGICGGYTTFSAFSLQSLTLFQQGAWLRGGGYVAASVGLCLLAVWAGYALGAAISWAFR
jgi:CrcB protein